MGLDREKWFQIEAEMQKKKRMMNKKKEKIYK